MSVGCMAGPPEYPCCPKFADEEAATQAWAQAEAGACTGPRGRPRPPSYGSTKCMAMDGERYSTVATSYR